jgi:hypothetical protein
MLLTFDSGKARPIKKENGLITDSINKSKKGFATMANNVVI